MNSKKVTEFGQLISNPELIEYLKQAKLSRPTHVQTDAIRPLLGDGNFTVQAKTGSGKTLAFLLPIFQKLKQLEAEGVSNEENLKGCPKALIVAPTRELAMQIFKIAKDLSHFAKLRVRKVVGGDKGKSLLNLFQSEIDILVATPDRALRAFEKGELKRKNLLYLVLDEADQLLEKSFEKTMAPLVLNVRNDRMQVFLVSASRPKNYQVIIKDFFPQREFETIGRGEENILPHKVDTFNSYLEEDDKFLYVNEFIKRQGKTNGLVFAGNKSRAKKLHELILKLNLEKVFLLHKDLERSERSEIVEQFRKSGGIMVATDVFARGIDIPHLNWVLNFDLPSEADYYLHRSGRVGRAGRPGHVYNFITKGDSTRQKNINEVLLKQGRDDLKINAKGSTKSSAKGSTKGSTKTGAKSKKGSNFKEKTSRSRNRVRNRK